MQLRRLLDSDEMPLSDIETVLRDFRSWLEQAAAIPPAPAGGVEESLDLHTLLGQSIALRHEVNLQTKAVRAQQEQNKDTLEQLEQTVALLRQNHAALAEAREDQLRTAFQNAGVDAIELSTEDDVTDAVLRFADMLKHRFAVRVPG